MNLAESIIQDLYKNRESLPKDIVAYIDDEYPITIRMPRNYREVSIEDFEFSFTDLSDSYNNFHQKGPIPCDKFNTYVDMMPNIKEALENVIQAENRIKIEMDYQREVYESIPTDDDDIDDRAPTEEEEAALTYTPDVSEIELGEELMEEYEQELAEAEESKNTGNAERTAEENTKEMEEELDETEDLTEEENERIIAEARVNRSQQTQTETQQETEEIEEEMEEDIEEEIDEESKKKDIDEELDEEFDEEAERIKKNPNIILNTDDEKETTDKIINQYADRQYTDGMDDIDHTYADGRKCKTENVTPTNPKIFDDDLPGIIVKIDGRRVTRKEFEQFIKEHKEEFVRVYNEKYEEKIKEKEERMKNEKSGEKTEEKTKDKQKDTQTKSETKKNDYQKGVEALKETIYHYSNIPWKQADIQMDNGDKIHIDRKVKPDQQLHEYFADYTLNGKKQNFGAFAKYVSRHENEIKKKITEELDRQRAAHARRNQEMDR